MSKIERLIEELCPDGVEFYKISDIADTYIGLVTCMTKNYRENGVLMINNSNIKEGYFEFKKKIYLDSYFADKNEHKKNKIGDILTVHTGDVGTSAIINESLDGCIGFATITTRIKDKRINNKFVCALLNSKICKNQIKKMTKGDRNNLNLKDYNKLLVPVPPLPVQEEIVRILDSFTELKAQLEEELEARKKQYEYYLKYLISDNSNSKVINLGEIGEVSMCKRIMKAQTSSIGEVPFYKIGTFGKEPDAFITKELFLKYKNMYSYPKKGDLLISASGTIGRVVVFDGEPSYFQDSNIVWIDNDETKVLNKFLYYCYKLYPWRVSNGGTISRLYNDDIKKTKILIPSLKEQEQIVDILDRFDKLCNDITEGLPAEIDARQKQYEYYRDKLLTFKRLEDREGIENERV